MRELAGVRWSEENMSNRNLLDWSVLFAFLICFAASCWGQAGSPTKNLDALIASAQANGDKKGERRVTNLKYALSSLKPSELNGVRCGKAQNPIKVNPDEAE